MHRVRDAEPPLRAELFSSSQMEQHGGNLAATHRLSLAHLPDQLLARLSENENTLIHSCNLLRDTVKITQRITPAGEWLLDNFYLIEDQIHTAKRHLPKRYSRGLPKLAHGPTAGFPRVYDIALETIAHGDGRVDPEGFSRFIAAYQKVTALTLGELWAIPIMLRLALIENLRRVTVQVAASATELNQADIWADRMLEVARQDPNSLILAVADMARSNPPMTGSFVAELARRLQGQSAALALPLTWIEHHLSESDVTIEQLVQLETQMQASRQVSISNSIGGLRFLGEMDWREFVETMSIVEQKLRGDPAGIYANMDFATRDRYRHTVERLAKASPLTESEVADKAIQLAQQSTEIPGSATHDSANDDRLSHVGYYLIDQGLLQLQQAAAVRMPISALLRQSCSRISLLLYLGAISFLTLMCTAFLLVNSQAGRLHGWILALMAILLAMCTSHLAIALVNWAANLLAIPHVLPRMNFSAGLPSSCRTLVVIPSMLTSLQCIEELVEALEVRFLANRDTNLLFGLLTDFVDAQKQTMPNDEVLLALATKRIDELNQKYRNVTSSSDCFFLFHRQRRWNALERLWMGYERKRGKLAELNATLRGGRPDSFSLTEGAMHALSSIKYVITLDTDTQLPRDSARQLVSTMAHPLNRARFDNKQQLVTGGYGILQPRITVSLPGTNRSRYARLFGSTPGIDPYTRAVSDVYQDVFGEGSFIGKGIYDVDAFEQSLKGRFPENRILSHDLLEGCYARAGLLSDVQMQEEHPPSYSTDVSRRHRWIRGDWQIASWTLWRTPDINRASATDCRQNTLSLLSQWKILDNLRRSLTPPALLILLLLGWTVLLPAWYWTLVVIGIILVPSLFVAILDLVRKPDDTLTGQHLAAALRTSGVQFAQVAFTLSCLPHEAFFSLDAVIRTNWRIWVTQKRLLEWTSSDSLESGHHTRFIASYQSMWVAPVIAIATAAWLTASAPGTLVIAGPILFLWFASPAIVWWLGQPIARGEARLTADQIIFLRKQSRKTWSFFETFVGSEDNWLPPDNYQKHPVTVIAHRTSPTNMGLALLANLSAYDFGYIATGPLIERTTRALATMASLKRHRGHFYNWYDTQSLQPLAPRYISSVDSGNLAGHLLTLRPGLLALPDHGILGPRLFDGVLDTLGLLADAAEDAPPATRVLLEELRKDLESACKIRPATLMETQNRLVRLATAAQAVTVSLDMAHADAPESATQWWAEALSRQLQGAIAELKLLIPWLALAAAPDSLRNIADAAPVPTLRELANSDLPWLAAMKQQTTTAAGAEQHAWLYELQLQIAAASRQARNRIVDIKHLAQQAGALAVMEYGFLYDKARHLLAIGFNVDERRLDPSYYDLLASEARLSTFVAIAQGQLPQESWFALGRLLTTAAGKPTLLSWSGSMFEYLMPNLVMPTYENSLLDQTCKAAVARQIAYAKQRGVPWGISECGYNAVDAAHNYQYRAFGVPGLGLKRGLSEDLVITPYASALALMIMPEAACLNLQRLAADGLAGQFGFYEAIDYTASRLPSGKTSVLIRSFMAHHQGMIFLSLAYLLLDRPMQKRFESEPMLQATTLLLQERAPRAGVFQQHNDEFPATPVTASGSAMPIRVFGTPDTQLPEVQLLSNGRYHVMLTNAGGGYSRWKDLALTRWREDTTCDNWGTFCYIRDLASGVFWSNTHQPTLKHADTCETIFSEGRAEFRRHDLDYDTYTEIVVSPEDDIELRRVRISNRARTRRTIEITSYAEVVLAAPAAEALHPAFSNLFVQTEIIRERNTILCTRRPRSLSEQSPWMFHLMTLHGAATGEISYETDRLRFIGRGHTVASPHAMIHSAPLSGSSGSVLDPVVAIRYRITLEPEQTVMIDLVSGISTTRDAALLLAGKYQDRQLADRVFDLAWTHGQIVLRQINGSEVDAQLYARLAGSIIYANSGLRADAGVLKRNKRGQSGLWGYAISGDLPIVLLQIGDSGNIDLVRQLVQAHAYWRLKGLSVDLVIWNEDRAGYRQSLQEQIMGLIAAGLEAHVINRPGGIFVRPAEQISDEDRVLVQSVARAIISDRRGTLGEQLDRVHLSAGRAPHLKTPPFKASRARRTEPAVTAAVARDDLLLFNNGLGGFSPDGREYVITTSQGHTTPLPWVNVLANAHFGTVVSESGAAYTWCENAHEFRLTPWCNDPVSDPGGETFYLRDEESGHFWSPTPLPSGGTGPYVSRHGFGYSCFEHTEEGISSELTVFVALDAAVKFSILKVRNGSGHSRRLSATGYVEWVMGDQRPKSAMHVITEIDPLSGAFYARNAYNTEFADRIAFFDVDDKIRTVSGDRAEFIGRNGTLANPVAMSRAQLSNKVGAALDPCAAIQVAMELADGEERVFTFRLGVAGRRGADESNQLVQRFRGSTVASDALKAVRQYWVTTLGGVQVETPDKSLNLLTNGWLLYQTLACRLWGRSGYYQSGGAFGFRDQLQDAMALVYAEPALVREHLLRCAARQFVEGDVQHWWQPTSGRGVRTHCSDDFLWLPLAMCRYVASTGDTGVLDEPIAFIEGRAIKPGEDSYYDLPGRSAETASLYQHGIRAILRGLRFGEHGLPLIGSGDWNDGMNTVGNEGKGESVWLAFFLYDVLMQFARLAAVHNDASFAERCQKEAAQLRLNIDRNGWDGEWYLRAYFDDGTPLGSADDAECQIDAVAQSWAVLSGAGDPVRARTAMAAVDHRLVRRDHALIQLLDPPFDKSMSNPGYIKGYVPGVRENGGQYTHAAIWTVMAFAALGDRRRAWELFDMINPVNHANSEAAIAVYKVEPYVVAADVYAVVPHIGRGGWTWYTGSAGWMYRLILESLLGLKLEADKLRFEPCLPESWETFKLQYRYCETDYHITVFQTHATNKKACVIVDGAEQADDAIALVNDRLAHEVEVHTYRTSG
jgi:cellobiose phosphorylase